MAEKICPELWFLSEKNESMTRKKEIRDREKREKARRKREKRGRKKGKIIKTRVGASDTKALSVV